MKNKSIWIGLVFIILLSGTEAAPVGREIAAKTAERFYSVQLQRQNVAKSLPKLSCVYPEDTKSTGFVPFYIFNAEQKQGFVIVAGDDNASSLILGYSDKGSFETDNMPENLSSWLEFYADGVKKAAAYGQAIAPKAKYSFSRAEVVKEPLLNDIEYNQDAPYNDLCPLDPTTNRRSYTGCVATALVSIARYYGYPEKGEGSISYTTPKGSTLFMDFSQNTYDWSNILNQYKGSLSQYTEEQRTAVATIMRDMGYAVKMGYGSDASGAYRDNTIAGMVAYMGFDSAVSYRERTDYDNDDQWVAVLKDNLDRDIPVYYTGQGNGGGHAFVCDGYDDADFFHINWGWGGSSNGYFVVRNLDPNDISGIGAGTGGGYTSMQGILFNMVPRGHAHSEDVFFLTTSGSIETSYLKEDSLYSINTPLEIPINGLKNHTMTFFKGAVALAAFKDGEFVRIISDEEAVEVVKQQTASVRLSLKAELNSLENGDYEIWVVSKAVSESMWQKVYAAKSNRYTNDSYIPLRIEGEGFKLLGTTARLTVNLDCASNQYISMYIYVKGELVGEGQLLAANPKTFTMRHGTYELRFWVRDYDTSYVNLTISHDTTIDVAVKERFLPPYIQGVRVNRSMASATVLWLKERPQGERAYPTGFVLYLDSVEVARVSSSITEYTYEKVPKGYHFAGVSSIYATGESDIENYRFLIPQDADNEKHWDGTCRISPNPSHTGLFTVETDRECRLQVCDLMGKVLFEEEMSSGLHQVDMQGFGSGVYLFRLYGRNGETMTLKAVRK